MPKATNTDITALGFDASQFGAPADFAAYIDAILASVEIFVSDAVGSSVYSGASGATLERIKQAEINLAAAELWHRIEIFERANASVGLSDNGAETISSRALKTAEAFEARAWQHLGELGASQDGRLAVGYNETGPYTEAGA